MNYKNDKETAPRDYKNKKKKVKKPTEMVYAPLAKKKTATKKTISRPGDRKKPKSEIKRPKPKTKSKSTGKTGLINKSNLTASIKKRMVNHAEHHSTKHLSYMIGKIENGKNFSEAHLLAQKALGK